MNLLARILSHGFAIAIVLLLALGLIYRGELFPDWKLPEFLSLGTPTVKEATDTSALEPIVEPATPVASTETAPAVTQVDEPAAAAESPIEIPAALPVETPETTPAAAPADTTQTAPALAPLDAAETTPASAPMDTDETAPAPAPVDATEMAPIPAHVDAAETAPIPAPVDAAELAPALAPIDAAEMDPAPAPIDADEMAPALAPADAAETAPATTPPLVEPLEETSAVPLMDKVDTAAPVTHMIEPAAVPEVTQPAASIAETEMQMSPDTPAAVVASDAAESAKDTSSAALSGIETAAPEVALPEMAGGVSAVPPAAEIDTGMAPGIVSPTDTVTIPAVPLQPTAAPVHEQTVAEPAIPAPAATALQPEEPASDETQPTMQQPGAVPPKARSYEVLAAAREAYWLRDYKTAESKYLQLTIMEPDNPDGYGELGNMYFSQGQWEKAASAYFDAGMRLVKEGQLEQARQLVDVIRGLDGAQADELNKQIVAAEAAPH